jgi:hypothetical protein
MSKDQVETARELAVFDFLTYNYGSVLLEEHWNYAVIQTGGLSRSQVRGHSIVCLVTCGLWIPAFLMITILRCPRKVLLSIDHDGRLRVEQLESEYVYIT